MENKSVEIKVGIFVIIGIIIIALFTLFIGRNKLQFMKGYTLYTTFSNVAGLDVNGPVRIAGVEVGKVTEIALVEDKAKLTLVIDPDVKIYKDAQVEIRTYGALGDKFLMVYPGTADSGLLADGDTITDTLPEADIADVIRDIRGVTASLNEALGGEDGKKNLKEIVSNLKETTTNINNITAKINNGEGSLGKLMNDDAIYNDVKESTKALSDVAKKIEAGEGTIGKLAQDDTLYNEAENTIREFRKSAEGIQEQTPISVMSTIFGLFF